MARARSSTSADYFFRLQRNGSLRKKLNYWMGRYKRQDEEVFVTGKPQRIIAKISDRNLYLFPKQETCIFVQNKAMNEQKI